MSTIHIFWFRRDLRLDDNAALFHALKNHKNVLPIFIFDKKILDKLENRNDKRVSFIHNALLEIQEKLIALGSTLEVFYGTPEAIFNTLLANHNVESVFANHDYEPYAIERDNTIKEILHAKNISFHTFKDQVIFEKTEITKDDGLPYTIFTPYSKKWKVALTSTGINTFDCTLHYHNFLKRNALPIPSLASMGFATAKHYFPSKDANIEIIKKYSEHRDFPGMNGTSKLGVHLRFGTISIRKLCQTALQLNDAFLNELIWRDFYHAILFNFPHVGKGKAFKEVYDNIVWRNNENEFEAWCSGKTGYPIVDAGMRELNETGFMHNRVRMIAASFLVKHLLIDWRWGEQYFAQKLLDFDLAANNGGWQWASSSGCDAAPYFRIFNPTLQMDKFDKERKYITKWIPELQSLSYPTPIVVHEYARKRVLEAYAKALGK